MNTGFCGFYKVADGFPLGVALQQATYIRRQKTYPVVESIFTYKHLTNILNQLKYKFRNDDDRWFYNKYGGLMLGNGRLQVLYEAVIVSHIIKKVEEIYEN